jgi:hypothetical protein
MPKSNKSESGLGQIFIVAIIIVVLAVAGVLIWSLTKNSNNNSSSNSTTSTANTADVNSNCQNYYHDSILCAFANHIGLSAYSYTASGTATSSTGTQSSFTFANDGKGNREITYTSSAGKLSMIVLDGSEYIQSGSDTTWLEYSGSNISSATPVPDPTSNFNLSFSSTELAKYSFAKEGTVACGRLSCVKYKVNIVASPAITQYVYFDTSSYLLRQWTYNDPATGVSVNSNLSYQAVTITKPSPVQQVSI